MPFSRSHNWPLLVPFCLVLTFAVASAGAQTATWTGAADGTTFGNANNWSPVGVPSAGSDVIFPAGPALTFSSGLTLRTLASARQLSFTNLNTRSIALSESAAVTISGLTLDVDPSSSNTVIFSGIGTVSVRSGGILLDASSGTFNIGSGIEVRFLNSTGVNIQSGGTLNNGGTITFTASGVHTFIGPLSSIVNNTGAISVTAPAQLQINTPLNNIGLLRASGTGTFARATGGLSNLVAGALNSGTYESLDGAVIELFTSSTTAIRTIGANARVLISGPNSRILGPLSRQIHASLEQLSGILTYSGGPPTLAVVPVSGTFTNSGALQLLGATQLSITGNYVQQASGRYRLGVPLTGQTPFISATTAAVAGTFEASYLPPTPSQVYRSFQAIVTGSNGRSGTFTSVLGDGFYMPEIRYTASSINFDLLSCPRISQQPVNSTVCGRTHNFSLVASANRSPLQYQWQVETNAGTWVNLGVFPVRLPCGGEVTSTGSQASPAISVTLTGCIGTYSVRCIVINSCGSTISNVATFTATLPSPCGFADLVDGSGNPASCGDGSVDGNDFTAFLNAFASGGSVADVVGGEGNPPGDGSVDGNDFAAFLNAFSAGC